MLAHFCDSCGASVDHDSGVIEKGEVVWVAGSTKFCMWIDLHAFTLTGPTPKAFSTPCLCNQCVLKGIQQWLLDLQPVPGTNQPGSPATSKKENSDG